MSKRARSTVADLVAPATLPSSASRLRATADTATSAVTGLNGRGATQRQGVRRIDGGRADLTNPRTSMPLAVAPQPIPATHPATPRPTAAARTPSSDLGAAKATAVTSATTRGAL